MKKLLLILFFCASMFGWLNANDVQISYMKISGNNAKQTIIESIGDRQITLVRVSAANGIVSKKRLDTVLTSLVDTFVVILNLDAVSKTAMLLMCCIYLEMD